MHPEHCIRFQVYSPDKTLQDTVGTLKFLQRKWEVREIILARLGPTYSSICKVVMTGGLTGLWSSALMKVSRPLAQRCSCLECI